MSIWELQFLSWRSDFLSAIGMPRMSCGGSEKEIVRTTDTRRRNYGFCRHSLAKDCSESFRSACLRVVCCVILRTMGSSSSPCSRIPVTWHVGAILLCIPALVHRCYLRIWCIVMNTIAALWVSIEFCYLWCWRICWSMCGFHSYQFNVTIALHESQNRTLSNFLKMAHYK